MTILDDNLVPAVTNMIARLGRSATFTVTVDVYDPATGVNTPTPTGHVILVSPIVSRNEMFWNYTEREATSITQLGESRIFAAGENIPFTPVKGMKVTIDTIPWMIERIIPHASGTLIAAYEMWLKK